MKQIILSICLISIFAGCHDSNPDPSPTHTQITIDKSDEMIPFKISPSASDKLSLSFLHNQERTPKSLTLMKGTEKLITIDLIKLNGETVFTADLNYAFQENELYDFVVETNAVRDTLFTYHITNYHHTYVQTFQYHKIDNWTQLLEYDIDPERKFLFITYNTNDESILAQVSLQDFTIEKSPNHFNSNPIRAVSENEIISYSRIYNGRLLLGDSAALLKYNLTAGTNQLLDWISADYRRLSRIVNNHMIFSNPLFTSKTSTLLDLGDQTKTVYLNEDMNPLSFREDNFDNLYSGNTVFDWNTNSFTEKINVSKNSWIDYIDNTDQYVFALETNMNPDNRGYRSRLLVFKGNILAHQGDFEENCSYELGKVFDVSANKVLLFKNYAHSTVPRNSGYYLLDLITGKTKLVQCDNYDLVKHDFALNSNTLISVRKDGLYKITTIN